MAKKKIKYNPSIFEGQDDIYCAECGSTQYVTRHEIFFGNDRDRSKHWGCWINLCSACHDKLHFGKSKTLKVKWQRECQKKFEELYGHKKFMFVFRKNYL